MPKFAMSKFFNLKSLRNFWKLPEINHLIFGKSKSKLQTFRNIGRIFYGINSSNILLFTCFMRSSLVNVYEKTTGKNTFQNAFEVEKSISEIVDKAENFIMNRQFKEAKKILYEALRIAEVSNVYSNISPVYDLLSTIAFQEGGITEAEDLLVEFIEKLLQLGYPENHNSIIRFKLKLTRLYQIVGNREMAELGFRDIIGTQQQKLLKDKILDEYTNSLYVSSLFWYGKFLIENSEFKRAKMFLKKALERAEFSRNIKPEQVMVMLYYNAEVSVLLKDYDDGLYYLYQAIDLAKAQNEQNPDLPYYMIKIGLIQILKGAYETAEYWCKSGHNTGTILGEKNAVAEASSCLNAIEDFKKALQNKKTK